MSEPPDERDVPALIAEVKRLMALLVARDAELEQLQALAAQPICFALEGRHEIHVGDTVTRMLSGTVPMKLKVTAIDDKLIHCGPWTFDKTYGYEIDEELGWGVPDENGEMRTGSYILFAKRLPGGGTS